MRWWGWGSDAAAGTLDAHALTLLRDALDLGGEVRGPVALEEVRLPEMRLGEAAVDRLRAAAEVRTDREARVLHAAGRGYVDLVRLRSGRPDGAPDAVALPATAAQVAAVLEACAAEGLAVVPFGGGTSVVGGVAPVAERFAGVVSLDLGALDRVLSVDERSLTARVQAGVRGPELEADLAARGLTLGHFPQSFEYVTVGGCVATRSAGQASTGYGRIDALVLGLACTTPVGEIVLPAMPGTAAGPDLRELLIGSEGTLGVITEATLRVRPRPVASRYEAWILPSFAAGVEALRALEQGGAAPDVTRLSDADETRLSLGMAGATEGRRGELLRRYLGLRGIRGGCLMVLGWLGEPEAIAARRATAAAAVRREGGAGLGTGAGRSWERGRYHGPYLRDHLLDHGVLAETLETATTWSNLFALYAAVGDAMRAALTARGTPPLVGCHVSHLYPSGASLYFTFLARQERGAEVEQWAAAKRAASEAIVAAGGTITHHHAIGRDHVGYLQAETGALGIEALRAVKERLDPAGIMNPGKLVPDRPGG
jgi:alkyldihydroxyacetonephosphate synthase